MEEAHSGIKMDRRKRKTRAQIHAAFTSLLDEKELFKISVTDITTRADISRKTFYLHYRSIDDLIDELIQVEITHLANRLCEVSLDERGEVYVDELFHTLEEELLTNFNRRTAIMKNIDITRLMSRLCPIMVQEFIEKDPLKIGKKMGVFIEPFAAYYCSGLLGIYYQWATADSPLPIETISSLAGASLAAGIAALVEKAEQLKVSEQSITVAE